LPAGKALSGSAFPHHIKIIGMKTHNCHPEWYNEPLRLNEEETNKPVLVLDEFFQCYHLNEVRQTLWQWLVAALSSPGSVADDPHERNNHLYFYEKIESLVEANWVMRRSGEGNRPRQQERLPIAGNANDVQSARYAKPARLIEKVNAEPSAVIQEVFSEATIKDLLEYLLPTWLRVAVVSSESPYSDGEGRKILYEFYDQLLIFIEALYVLSEPKPGYRPSVLNDEQLADPAQVITTFFQQFSLDYLRRELYDFLDAGIGYDGNYPNGFTPWQAWMTYNHVLCLVEGAYRLYVHQEEVLKS
jgi:hypothetical protein